MLVRSTSIGIMRARAHSVVHRHGLTDLNVPVLNPKRPDTNSSPHPQKDTTRARCPGSGTARSGPPKTLWQLARVFLDVQNMLDERPCGGIFALTVAKPPLVDVAGGWLDECGGIGKARP